MLWASRLVNKLAHGKLMTTQDVLLIRTKVETLVNKIIL